MYRTIAYGMGIAAQQGMRAGALSGLVTDVDISSIADTEISVSALQEFWKSAAPSLQSLAFNIVAAIIIYFVGKRLISIATKVFEKFLSHTSIDVGVSTFLVHTAQFILTALLLFMIVAQLGVNTASIVTILGTMGLAVGMSLQGSLSNVAGGILILLMRPFRVGDYVSTSYGDGTVKMIGLVYTVITTVDNRALTIPNGALSNSAVFNANAAPERRLDTSVGISYDSDIALAKQIMEDVYRDCPGFIPDKDLNVHVSGLGDSAVTIEGFGWVRGSEYLGSKWYVLEEIKLRYDAAGVKIPFPQMDVHLDPS